MEKNAISHKNTKSLIKNQFCKNFLDKDIFIGNEKKFDR